METPPEPMLSRLVEIAAQAFDAPFALVSLLDRNTQWVRAAHGIVLDQQPRCDTFCNHVLDHDDVLEVCAPHADPRFATLPSVVGELSVRYYIGSTLRSASGIDIGTLCVLDDRTRTPASADQRAYLRALARQAMEMLELRPDLTMALPA